MMLQKEIKQGVINTFKRHEHDTGSPEVQVAILSKRIADLNDHFKAHAKDHHSRRGLIMMVSQRRKLLDYLKRTDVERYKKILGQLDIRR
jgi:small subunit ribosomal protein S15